MKPEDLAAAGVVALLTGAAIATAGVWFLHGAAQQARDDYFPPSRS